MTEALDFERAVVELESIVERLQRPDLPLADAISLYRKGTELADRSEALLSAAELQVQQLTKAVQERFADYVAEPEEDPEAT